MGRRLLPALLIAWPLTAWAAEPTPSASSCPNDLEATSQYAALIRGQRDAYEIEIARLRAHVKKLLEAATACAEAAEVVPGPTPKNP